MKSKLKNIFFFTAALIISITGLAKLFSAFGSGRILETPDPIVGIQFRYLLLLAGTAEIVVALTSLLFKNCHLKTGFIGCLTALLVLYRFGLWFLNWHRPFSCLGNLTDMLHIDPVTADYIMQMVLVYLFIGSCASWIWILIQKRKEESAL